MQSVSGRFIVPFLWLGLVAGSRLGYADPVTVRDVAFWRDMGYTDAGIQEKLAAATPPPSFSEADLAWLAKTGASPNVVQSAAQYGPGKVAGGGSVKTEALPTGATSRPPDNPAPSTTQTNNPPLVVPGGAMPGGGNGQPVLTAPRGADAATMLGYALGQLIIKNRERKQAKKEKKATAPEPLSPVTVVQPAVITSRPTEGREESSEKKETQTASVSRQPLEPAVNPADNHSHDLPVNPTVGATANPLAEVEAQRGESLLRENKNAEALAAFREAIRLDPTRADYYKRCGDVLSLTEQWAPAEAAYREAARLKPADATYQALLGQTCQRQQRWVEAEVAYREAVRLKPSETAFSLYLGNALIKQKKWSEATTVYRKVIRSAPMIEDAHAELAGALLRQDRRDEALAEAKEALRLGMDASDHWVFKELGLNP